MISICKPDLVKLFLLFVGRLISFIAPLPVRKFIYAISIARDYVYTGFLSKSFHGIGKGVIIAYKIKYHELCNISIGSGTVIEKDVELSSWLSKYRGNIDGPNIIMGNNCYIRRNSHITAVDKIVIGDNLLTGPGVLITDNSHGRFCEQELNIPPNKRPIYSKGPVVIGNNVWLGEKSSIMPGVKIGNGVVVAANAVVTHDVPDNCVVAGVPAKIIKQIKL